MRYPSQVISARRAGAAPVAGGVAGAGRGRGGRPASDRQHERAGPHQAADERLHGLVPGAAAQDGPGEPQDAQLGDLQAARRGVEAADGGGEAALHRRGQAAESTSHEGTPGLQVQTPQEAEATGPEEGGEAVPRAGADPAPPATPAPRPRRRQAPASAALPLPPLQAGGAGREQDGGPGAARALREVAVLGGGGGGLDERALRLPRGPPAQPRARHLKAAPGPARAAPAGPRTGTPPLALVAAPAPALLLRPRPPPLRRVTDPLPSKCTQHLYISSFIYIVIQRWIVLSY